MEYAPPGIAPRNRQWHAVTTTSTPGLNKQSDGRIRFEVRAFVPDATLNSAAVFIEPKPLDTVRLGSAEVSTGS